MMPANHHRDCRGVSRSARAFTLVEMLLATGLAALLTTTLALLIGSTAHQEQALLAGESTPSWLHLLEQTVRHDMENARRMMLTPGRLTLLSDSPLHTPVPASGMPTPQRRRPVLIHYEVIEHNLPTLTVAPQYMVVRLEEEVDAKSNQNVRIDLVCTDIAGLEVLPMGARQDDVREETARHLGIDVNARAAPAERPTIHQVSEMSAVPSQLHLKLHPADPGASPWELTIVLR